MSGLKDYSNEDLKKELQRREVERIPRPELRKVSYGEAAEVFRPLFILCKDYLDDVEKGYDLDSDIPHYVFEEAMGIFYGEEVWKWISYMHKVNK